MYNPKAMSHMQFDGQQSDERILLRVTPHKIALYISIIRLGFLSIVLCLMLFLISAYVPIFTVFIRFAGLLFALCIFSAGYWWNIRVYKLSSTYITDRRIIRFEVVSPFFQTKRALFWNEALKAKGYAPNMVYRMFNVGTVQVEPHLSDQENVRITDVFLYDDVANYIDKILFTFKNKPSEIAAIQPFIAKPKGMRSL